MTGHESRVGDVHATNEILTKISSTIWTRNEEMERSHYVSVNRFEKPNGGRCKRLTAAEQRSIPGTAGKISITRQASDIPVRPLLSV